MATERSTSVFTTRLDPDQPATGLSRALNRAPDFASGAAAFTDAISRSLGGARVVARFTRASAGDRSSLELSSPADARGIEPDRSEGRGTEEFVHLADRVCGTRRDGAVRLDLSAVLVDTEVRHEPLAVRIGALLGLFDEFVDRLADAASGVAHEPDAVGRYDLAHADRLATIGMSTAFLLHEINNHVTTITTRAAAVERFADKVFGASDVVRHHARALEEAADRLHHIVRAFGGLARRDPDVLVPIGIGALVADALFVCADEIARRSVAVRVDLAEPSTERMLPRIALLQVLVNLVKNAIHASPVGGEVRVRSTFDSGHVEIHVEDDGGGVPEAIRERIFDPSFTTKHDGLGLGLGLAISRELVHRNGGALRLVARGEGAGASFVVRIRATEVRR